MESKLSFAKEKIKVLLLENIHPNALQIFKNAGYENVTLLNGALSEDELIEALQDVRLLGIRSKTRLTRRVLQNAPRLQSVGCFCIGTNQVDLQTATELGIAVFNSPYNNTRSVAELIIADIIMLLRGIPQRNAAAHRGEWLKTATGSHEVRGKVLGIVGYGHIGSQVSVLAEAMGMKVIYYDIVPKLHIGNAQAVETLEELLATANVVTLHVPATPQTRYMVRAEALALMKPNAILLNLSRGNVVDIDALRDALVSKHLAGAAVDVFPAEPKSKHERFVSPLQGLENVILTPHIGGSTEEAQANIGNDAAQKLVNYMDNGSTFGSHTVPELHLPTQQNTHRILHVHHNVPGMMSKINLLLSDRNINIVGQYLKTNESVGYVVLDVQANVTDELMADLKAIEHTIKARVLY